MSNVTWYTEGQWSLILAVVAAIAYFTVHSINLEALISTN